MEEGERTRKRLSHTGATTGRKARFVTILAILEKLMHHIASLYTTKPRHRHGAFLKSDGGSWAPRKSDRVTQNAIKDY